MSRGLIPDVSEHPIIPEDYWRMAWDRFYGVQPDDKSDPSILAACLSLCGTPPAFILRNLSELLGGKSQKQPHLKFVRPPRYSENSAITQRQSMMALKALYNSVTASSEMPDGRGSQTWAIQEVRMLFEKEKYPVPSDKLISAAVRYSDRDFTKELFSSLYKNVPWPPPENKSIQEFIDELVRPENHKRPQYGKVSLYLESAKKLMEKYFP